jgi:hypothetical protein
MNERISILRYRLSVNDKNYTMSPRNIGGRPVRVANCSGYHGMILTFLSRERVLNLPKAILPTRCIGKQHSEMLISSREIISLVCYFNEQMISILTVCRGQYGNKCASFPAW